MPDRDLVHADLCAVFTDASGTKKVKGFYAGDGICKVRYLPESAGRVTWKVTGIAEEEGEAECEPAAAGDRGIVRADGTALRFSDGSPFFSFGTTVYALAHQNREITEQTFETLSSSPFNKVRMCVFPKHYDYNVNDLEYFPFEVRRGMRYSYERGETFNSEAFNAGKAKLWDVERPCFDFWDALEEKLLRLGRLGIQADLILFHPYDRWGFSCLDRERDLVYLDYLLRRFAAIPNVWWSMANEYDLCPHKTMEDWYAIEAYIAGNDPFHHMLSCHNCFAAYDFARPAVTHCSLQKRTMTLTPSYMKRYGKPVLYDECVYEGNLKQSWGSLSGKEMMNRFWKVTVQGGYCTHGEVYLDPELEDTDQAVLWWAKGGRLTGESPSRIAFLRELIGEIGAPLLPCGGGFAELAERAAADPALQAAIPAGLHMLFESRRRMGPEEKALFDSEEAVFAGRTKDESHILYYCGTDCFARYDVSLLEDARYRIEIIDAWNMTRELYADGVSGRTEVRLPGREYMAVLCTRE